MLLTQLYDPDLDIQEAAVRYLEEACESNDVLEMVVEMHPTLDHLGDIGNGLLLKCVFRFWIKNGILTTA